ncbi:MAG: hypothetical protein ACRDZY_17625 [Acidimicrobiales bacterium]
MATATGIYVDAAQGVGLGPAWLNRALMHVWGPPDITPGIITELCDPADSRFVEAVGVLVLVEECEAFLTGTYADYLETGGAAVPLWARLNPLCHRSEAAVTELAAGRRLARRSTWPSATAHLAHLVLRAAARQHMALTEIQSAVLVPLELALADRPVQTQGQPLELVRAVTGLLRDHPVLKG